MDYLVSHMNSLLDDISQTAFLVAACRANELLRKTPLFRDDAALLYMDKEKNTLFDEFKRSPQFHLFNTSVVVRTATIDRMIMMLIEKKGIQQIVNLGAGLDNRPYRLSLPNSFIWWEFDYEDLIDFKSEKLSHLLPCCQLRRIGMDLNNIDQLANFVNTKIDHSKKLAILSEGFLIYIDPSMVSKYLSLFSKLNFCSYWLTDIGTEKNVVERSYQDKPLYSKLVEYMKFFSSPQDSIYSANSWEIEKSSDLAMEALNLHRPLSIEEINYNQDNTLLEIQSFQWSQLYYFLLLKNRHILK